MKKFSILAAVVLAAIMGSCTNSAPKADMKNDVDTLSYSIGMAQSRGLKEYLTQRMGVDTTYIDEFIKGIVEGANAGESKKKAAYYAGLQMGQQISTQWIPGISYEMFGDDSVQTASLQNLLSGFIDGSTGNSDIMSVEVAVTTAETLMPIVKKNAMEAKFGDIRKYSWRHSSRREKSIK